jgi:hypothetical protein
MELGGVKMSSSEENNSSWLAASLKFLTFQTIPAAYDAAVTYVEQQAANLAGAGLAAGKATLNGVGITVTVH